MAKIERNMARDSRVDAELSSMGWRVLRFWGSDIMRDVDGAVDDIHAVLSGHGNT